MLYLKWFLLGSIFLTSSFLGFAYGDRYAKRVLYLRELLQSIKVLKTEIIILSNPLPIALKNVSAKSDSKINKLYEIILKDLITRDTEDLYSSFIKTKDILENQCFFTKEDVDLFVNLGKTIGKTDRLDQDKHFTHLINELTLAIREAKVEKDKNLKMYRSLGLLMGLGAIIILV